MRAGLEAGFERWKLDVLAPIDSGRAGALDDLRIGDERVEQC